jgi:hypothetical protein
MALLAFGILPRNLDADAKSNGSLVEILDVVAQCREPLRFAQPACLAPVIPCSAPRAIGTAGQLPQAAALEAVFQPPQEWIFILYFTPFLSPMHRRFQGRKFCLPSLPGLDPMHAMFHFDRMPAQGRFPRHSSDN